MKRRTFRQLAWVVLLLCGTHSAFAESEASAGPLSVTLDYEVPDACPGAREFKAVVSHRLGRDPFVERSPHHVFVQVSRLDETMAGDLVWRDESGSSVGQQSFPSTTNHCAQLISAMGFALAVQIQLLETSSDPGENSTSQSEVPAPAPTPQRAAAPPHVVTEPEQPSAAADPPANPEQRNRQAAQFFAGGGGGIAVGMSSQVLPVGRLFAGVRWTALALEFGFEASLPAITRRADGAGFSQRYLLGSTAGCGVFPRVRACALFKAGAVKVSGRDIDVPSGASAPLLQSGVRLDLSQGLSSRAFLSLRSEGLVNLTHWSVRLDQTPVWSSPRFAFVSGLDFTVLF